MEERDYHLLREGRRLNNRYIIRKVLGEGGFGITYFGRDTLLDVNVAIKEFFPQGVATRNNSVNDMVTVSYAGQKENFQRGKMKFLEEAKIVARFKYQPGIVDVTDYFEANNTAYIVMEYLDGITLKQYIRLNGPISAEDIREMSVSIMEALDEIHKHGLIHRDISPDNIMLLPNGGVKLMDFGAARDYTGFGEKSLSIVLKPGYAPEEQYRSRGVQGPWTDIYALSATLYKAITGVTPEEAMQRVIDDTMRKPSELGVRIPASMEYAIMKGLSVFQKDRYQNLGDFCQDLYGDGGQFHEETSKKYGRDKQPSDRFRYGESAEDSGSQEPSHKGSKKLAIGVGVGTAVCLLLLIVIILVGSQKNLPDVPLENTIRSDVQTYIAQNVDSTAQIIDFTLEDQEINSSDYFIATCIVDYNDETTEYTDQFVLTYDATSTSWTLVACTLDEDYTLRSSVALDADMTGSTEEEESATEEESKVLTMSDDLDDYTFTLDGVVYQLPFAYTELEDNGWSCSVSTSEKISGESHQSVTMRKDDTQFIAYIVNFSGNAKKIKKCKVGGIQVDAGSDMPEFSIAEGITVGASEEEVREAFGDPQEVYEASNNGYVTLTYGEGNIYTEFYCDTKDDDYDYSEIIVENFTADADDEKTETSEEVPEYLSTYTAPSSLGEDKISGNIEIEGDLYTIPCTVSAFLNNGWEITYQEGSVASGRSSTLDLSRDGKELYLSITNFSDYQTIPKNCAVTSVGFSEYSDASFTLPGGLTKESSSTEAEEWVGTEFNYSKNGDSETYSYYEYDNRYFSLYINYENGTFSYMSIDCDTWPE